MKFCPPPQTTEQSGRNYTTPRPARLILGIVISMILPEAVPPIIFLPQRLFQLTDFGRWTKSPTLIIQAIVSASSRRMAPRSWIVIVLGLRGMTAPGIDCPTAEVGQPRLPYSPQKDNRMPSHSIQSFRPAFERTEVRRVHPVLPSL